MHDSSHLLAVADAVGGCVLGTARIAQCHLPDAVFSVAGFVQVLSECITPVTCKPSLMPSVAASRLLHGLHSIFHLPEAIVSVAGFVQVLTEFNSNHL